MKPNFLFYGLMLLLFFLAACNNTPTENTLKLEIKLSSDSSAVTINRLPQEFVLELQQSDLDVSAWKQLFAVFEAAQDPDMQGLLAPLAGSYEIVQQSVSFKPNLPFKKGKSYIVQVYAQNLQLDANSLFKRRGWQMKQRPLEYKFKY